jgi:dolichyl-phosphate-mannose-protein mannosyltransferase
MSVLRRATVPRAPSPRRSVVGRGLAGVLLSFAVLATLQALTIHPFHPPDEMSHVGYALEVGHGRLPTIETPIPGREIPLLQHKVDNSRPANRTIWTANHPPLYYLVAAVPLRLGVELGHPTAGIRVARLVNVAISLAGLVLIVLLARELVPARPELWVGAAGLAALVPVFVQTSAIVYNDALMVALTTAVLLLIARVLRWGRPDGDWCCSPCSRPPPRSPGPAGWSWSPRPASRPSSRSGGRTAVPAVAAPCGRSRPAAPSWSPRRRPPAGSTSATGTSTTAPPAPAPCWRSSPG